MRTTRQERSEQKRAEFETIVNEHESELLRYATRVLHNSDTAQDVVQDTFLKLFRHWGEVRKPGASLSSWLYRVAHNLAVDHIRKRDRLQKLHLRQSEERETLAAPKWRQGFGESAAAEKARLALDGLDLRERQVVLLKVYEGKTYREISEITGLSSGNVGYILHHAIKKMARQIKESDPHEKQSEP